MNEKGNISVNLGQSEHEPPKQHAVLIFLNSKRTLRTTILVIIF